MSVPSGNSRIVAPFFPSLFHASLVTIAAHFLEEFDIETLNKVSTNIQQGISTRFNESSQNDLETKRAQEKMLFIPAHLRHYVFKAISRMHWDIESWFEEHSCILNSIENIGVCLRSDGTISRTKTAQNLVMNEKINIYNNRERFHLACMYCLEDNVLTLWKEMETSREIKNFETGDKFMTSFWVRWIKEGCQVPWLQAVKEYLVIPQSLWPYPPCRLSSFFPLLQPKDRKKFLTYLEWACYDDFRFCLYSATKEEEAKILVKDTLFFLFLYLTLEPRDFQDT